MRLLILEDNKSTNDVISALATRASGFTVTSETDSARALALVSGTTFDLIVTDQQMPGMTGLEFTRHLRSLPAYSGVPIIMVTANKESTLRKEAVEAGVTDFILKPIEPIEFKARLMNLLALRRNALELDSLNAGLEERVKLATLELRRRELETIERLAIAIEYRDNETGAHVARMASLCRIIARQLAISEDRSETISHAAVLHDIGKVGVPDNILRKPGALTDSEMSIMRRHAEIGGLILANGKTELIKVAANIALYHHERWDGTGYPMKIKGEQIPIEARIASIADVFEALTSDRVYRKAYSLTAARQFIEEGSGSQFDPLCVAAFVTCFNSLAEIITHQNSKPHFLLAGAA